MAEPYFVPNPGLPTPKETQNPRIRPSSPLAVIGLFVEVIRARFQESVVGTSLPWIWDRDIKKSTIAIESAYNEDQEHKNKRPAVFVDIDGAVLGRTVVGDRVDAAFHAHAVGRAEEKVLQCSTGKFCLNHDVEASWASTRLPSGLKSMEAGTLTWGRVRAACWGEAASRLKT